MAEVLQLNEAHAEAAIKDDRKKCPFWCPCCDT